MAKTEAREAGLGARVERGLSAPGPRDRTQPSAADQLTAMLARSVGPTRATASAPRAQPRDAAAPRAQKHSR